MRIFVAIVRRGLWHHITGEEEARAVAALTRFDGTNETSRGSHRTHTAWRWAWVRPSTRFSVHCV